MYHFSYTIKDSTIYEYAPDQNVGADEILELDRVSGQESRILSKFNVDDNLFSFVEGVSGLNYTCGVEYTTTEVSNLPTEYDIVVSAVSSDWDRGTGRKFNSPTTTEGVTWKSRGPGDWFSEGGDFYPATESTISYEFERSDIDIDITTIFDDWMIGMENNGIIVRMEPKYPNTTDDITLKYFGDLTHTIYRPRLVLKYDSSEINKTGASAISDGTEVVATFDNLEREYTTYGIRRISLNIRDRYQKQNFVEKATPYTPGYFEDGVVEYRVKDYKTGKVIIPFSKESRASFNATEGYYFDLDLDGWMPNRYYELDIRYKDEITRVTKDLTPYTNRFKITK